MRKPGNHPLECEGFYSFVDQTYKLIHHEWVACGLFAAVINLHWQKNYDTYVNNAN